ncbi:NAD(P)-dependent dehydrogenase (short-subunit alcohol dehydrogenase family) [Brevibacterium sanguinis]|uniref:NAD(P)-dependent dehydrogenase (Short-subunit alcohol dehydrogenase family) n=2 Tax=Brevibacterium TaxID=1696 RepID=A0A366IE49_9MICO|nr:MULTISPECIES: SDR family oxidoreductase [Brevibacterium]RBP62975.1 NAD(P)-dependent dehydrogenase (short-subunit alcohol dehydrogenase family) [Brevibacterium sanguinis]RBP69480.1 NAD(P)-dependent dehydrogenase (short-subunit alcohol dehydrogenase family) [Brevibacterium celere]
MGSTAIVTGGSRGIGADIVRRLARAGHHVLLVYSADDRGAEETATRCATADVAVEPLKCDITADDAPAGIFDAAARLGTPTTLVNNAGTTGAISPLSEASDETIRTVIDVNLTATIRLCREAMCRWQEADGLPRSIVNVSSVAAKIGSPGEYVWYAAAKAGVNALTTGLAVEAAPLGIRVNAVNPGTTNTTIHTRAGRPNRAEEAGRRSPMGRPAEPDEIAAAVEWLVSTEASYVNGTILDVAGGVR